MISKLKNLAILGMIALVGCVDPFTFNTSGEESIIVIEGFISDQSYNDLGSQPLDPRYFEVNLRTTSKVSNVLDQPVSGAEILLIDESNEQWDYAEDIDGAYRLYFEDFSAEEGKEYKIRVTLQNGEVYESTYERLPVDLPEGKLLMEEKEVKDYKVVLGETKIVDVKGLALTLETPENNSSEEFIYNKWDFETTYGFVARLIPTETDPNYRCWITEELYYNDFVIAKENVGGGKHDMFFFDSKDENLHEGFSVLVRQQMMNKLNYQFWQDLDNQKKQSDVFAPPPYNLISNLSPIGHEGEVYGYFGVVREKFYRWTFSSDMLSYPTPYPEDLKNSCNIPRPPRSCYDCRFAPLVSRSRITNTKPIWWEK